MKNSILLTMFVTLTIACGSESSSEKEGDGKQEKSSTQQPNGSSDENDNPSSNERSDKQSGSDLGNGDGETDSQTLIIEESGEGFELAGMWESEEMRIPEVPGLKIKVFMEFLSPYTLHTGAKCYFFGIDKELKASFEVPIEIDGDHMTILKNKATNDSYTENGVDYNCNYDVEKSKVTYTLDGNILTFENPEISESFEMRRVQ